MRKHPVRTLIATMVGVYGLLIATVVMGGSPNLGLDLQGGISVNLQPVEDGEVTDDVTDEELEDSIEIIRRRVDALGVAEPEVSRQGNTITVQLPGAKDSEEVLDVVGSTARLEFRPVLAVTGAILSGEDRTEAEERVEELRGELGLPEGVTAEQVASEEIALQAEAAGAAGAEGAPDAALPTPEAPVPVPSDAPAPAGEDEGALGATSSDGSANGGNRSARAPFQDDEPESDGDGTTSTTAPAQPEPPPPANQWGIDTSDEQFSELYALERQLDAELTPESERTDEAEVTLAGDDGTIYQLGPVSLTGEAVEGATAVLSQGQWTVSPAFRGGADGIDLFNEVAAQCYAGQPTCPALSPEGRGLLGIVLDGEVLSAPAINVPSFQRDQIQISGDFDQEEAEALAVALRYGSLPVVFEPQSAETVSATLGQGALDAGIISGLIGLALASLYLALYYRMLAVVAVGSLTISAATLWVLISWIGATVTLAGVVGIVVSVGVTVDSAIVYFETLKERVRGGATVRSAVDSSFDAAYSTIVKANMSSLIGAAILYWLAIGPVRGFAFYLGAMTLLNLVATYVFVYPATAVIGRSRLGARPASLGLPADQVSTPSGPGAPGPSPTVSTAGGSS